VKVIEDCQEWGEKNLYAADSCHEIAAKAKQVAFWLGTIPQSGSTHATRALYHTSSNERARFDWPWTSPKIHEDKYWDIYHRVNK